MLTRVGSTHKQESVVWNSWAQSSLPPINNNHHCCRALIDIFTQTSAARGLQHWHNKTHSFLLHAYTHTLYIQLWPAQTLLAAIWTCFWPAGAYECSFHFNQLFSWEYFIYRGFDCSCCIANCDNSPVATGNCRFVYSFIHRSMVTWQL